MLRPAMEMRRTAGIGQRGTSMIEVLVAIVIVVVGLLGLAGLQSRASMAELEAFQRAQGLVLMQDMVDRINANRRNALSYVTGVPMGTGKSVLECGAMNGAARDLCEWNNALLGAAETKGASQVGAMTGARGCVFNASGLATMPIELQVVISWQGTVQTKEPNNDCGRGEYGADGYRRSLTANVTIACLQNVAAGVAACTTTPNPPVPPGF